MPVPVPVTISKINARQLLPDRSTGFAFCYSLLAFTYVTLQKMPMAWTANLASRFLLIPSSAKDEGPLPVTCC